jgi:nucleoid DNA-binding protein
MTTKINRTELIDALALKLGVSKAQAERILNSFVETITEKLIAGQEINITGFGSFRPVTRSARDGINPKTRGKMKIPASKSVGFKVGKTLKEAVRNSK